MINDKQIKRFEQIKDLAIKSGLDPFDINIEFVNEEIMFDVCSYGLPTRPRHWSHGAAYDQIKHYGEMGYSKVYEIILNNDPAYAFLLESNQEIDNLLVVAHIQGHSDFFKHNLMFKDTDRKMVYRAAEHAERIESYIEQYGIERVEKLMDAAFALDKHIDWHKGFFRKKYPEKSIIAKESKQNEFDDILNSNKESVSYKKNGYELPPHPEKDILWFLANYAKLENWEKDILEIIRQESYYFFPQQQTKIMNEGWASFWHAEIMHVYNEVSPDEMIDFACTHERVVQPGTNKFKINPYYLGFKVWQDIENRFGREKMFDVRRDENDISFLRNYLTADLIKQMGLFTFGYRCERRHTSRNAKCPDCPTVEVKSKDVAEVVNAIIKPILNYSVPYIAITNVNDDILSMRHCVGDLGPLDHMYAEKTLAHIYSLWAGPIELETVSDENEQVIMCYDETGFEIIKG